MTEHIRTRRKLQEVPLLSDFESVLDRCTLSEQEKEIMRMHYIDKQEFSFIGDKLGFAERTIKAKHKKILRKISYAL